MGLGVTEQLRGTGAYLDGNKWEHYLAKLQGLWYALTDWSQIF